MTTPTNEIILAIIIAGIIYLVAFYKIPKTEEYTISAIRTIKKLIRDF